MHWGYYALVGAIAVICLHPLLLKFLNFEISFQPGDRQKSGSISWEAADDDDHYAVLGLTSSASEKDIKSAYRTLARKWHPDLNRECADCGARFAAIAKAYGILSDPVKKASYDNVASSGDFETILSTTVPLTRTNFEETVMASVRDGAVWLVEVYSDSNRACQHQGMAWDEAALQLDGLVHFGRINAVKERALVAELPVRVRVLPTIIAFVNTPSGVRDVLYSGNFPASPRDLAAFATRLFSREAISLLSKSSARELAVSSPSLVTNRLDVILISKLPSPTILYRFMSKKYQKFMRFHFVIAPQSGDPDAQDAFQQLLADLQLGPKTTLPHLVILPHNGDPPVSGRSLTRDSLDAILTKWKYASIPQLRKSNFDPLCNSSRQCVVLAVSPKSPGVDFPKTLREFRSMCDAKTKQQFQCVWADLSTQAGALSRLSGVPKEAESFYFTLDRVSDGHFTCAVFSAKAALQKFLSQPSATTSPGADCSRLPPALLDPPDALDNFPKWEWSSESEDDESATLHDGGSLSGWTSKSLFQAICVGVAVILLGDWLFKSFFSAAAKKHKEPKKPRRTDLAPASTSGGTAPAPATSTSATTNNRRRKKSATNTSSSASAATTTTTTTTTTSSRAPPAAATERDAKTPRNNSNNNKSNNKSNNNNNTNTNTNNNNNPEDEEYDTYDNCSTSDNNSDNDSDDSAILDLGNRLQAAARPVRVLDDDDDNDDDD